MGIFNARSPYADDSRRPITQADMKPPFFSRDRQRGLFGAPMLSDKRYGPYDTPPIAGDGSGDGMAPFVPPVSAGFEMPANLPAGKPKSSFFGEGGTGRTIIGTIGDALAGISGGPPIYAQAMAEKRRAQNEQLAQAAQWAHQAQVKAEDRAYEDSKPQYFSAGNDRVMFDPTTGTSKTVYDAPEAFQTYAGVFGQDGTPEYRTAAQDYVLRGNGPTAAQYDEQLEDARQENRVSLEGVRQGGRVSLEGIRASNRAAMRAAPTYRDLHPRAAAPARAGGGAGGGRVTMAGTIAPLIAKVARGEQLTPGEQQAYSMYRPGRRGAGGGAGGSAAGGGGAIQRVAVDGKGNKVGWNGKAWVPVK
jgi:hypothetical protein